ncbi:MFS transporter [Amycolatopsis sp. CA-161197]|uniref:MFS transporter n=1 Tax=Amycolatopsis sp. CA-161197 TaxID=3239922 RepID=UPI003D904971
MKDEAAAVSTEHVQSNGLLFRNRDYTGWWIGDTFSDFGSALSVVAYPLLVLAVTGSVAGAGVVEAAVIVGSLMTMLFGGVLADRFSRRAILVIGPLVQAAAVSGVVVAVLTGHVAVSGLAAVGFVQGLAGGLTQGAQLAALRRLVPDEQMAAAWGQYEARVRTIKLAGPAVGGFLFGVTRWVPFLSDALSFLASAVGVLLIKRPLGPDRDDEDSGPGESVFASIGAGLKFIRGNAYLRFTAAWVSLVSACYSGLVLLVIVIVQGRSGDASLVGAVSSIGALGGLAGALLSSRIVKRFPGRLLVITMSWTMAVVALAMGLVPGTWPVGALLAVMMFLLSPLNVVFATYEMKIIPDELMGRVQSAMSVASTSIQWLGPIAAGLLASALSPTAATIVFAGVMAVLAIATHFSGGLRALTGPAAAPAR